MTLPFGFIFSLGFYVIPVVAFIYYVLASLEMIAEEIEDPFGDEANDIPTNKISVEVKPRWKLFFPGKKRISFQKNTIIFRV